MNPIVLVDGTNLVFRSFYAIQKLTRSDGLCTNAVYGWIKSLWRLQDSYPKSTIAIFFDVARSKYRQSLFPEYKANRTAMPEELKVQLPLVKEVSSYMGFSIQESEHAEADDLIASFASKSSDSDANQQILIVSSDKDLCQCINDHVSLLNPGSWTLINRKEVIEKFGVEPSQIVDFLSLVGDTVDNIPGIPGIGQKTAAKLLQEYSSLENILSSINSLPERWRLLIEQNKELLLRNKKIVRLHSDCPLSPLPILSPNTSSLLQLFEKLELRSLLEPAKKRYQLKNQQLLLF